MVKLQIGENTVTLTAKEEDLFFELLDKNYDTIYNSPTFNAIYNWLKEDHDLSKETKEYLRGIPTVTVGDHQIPCKTIPELNKKEFGKKCDYYQDIKKEEQSTVEDPWTSEKANSLVTEDYAALRKLLGDLLNNDTENGYYIAL
jgi:hypothetical protein